MRDLETWIEGFHVWTAEVLEGTRCGGTEDSLRYYIFLERFDEPPSDGIVY